MVFATGFRGRWNGGLGLVYRSTNALRGLSGKCFVRGVETVFNSFSMSEERFLKPVFPYFSIGENGRFKSPKSDREADLPCEEGL